MNFLIKDRNLSFLSYNNGGLKDTLIFYFDKEWNDYAKVVVLKNYKNEEYALKLTNNNWCRIPDEMKDNQKISVKVIGVNKNGNKIETDKIVSDRVVN